MPGHDQAGLASAFAATHWSWVLAAKGNSASAQYALEKLCRTYWRPLYAFVLRQGFGPEEAQDIIEGLFALLLERRGLGQVRRAKGRLRSYLLGSLKHFLANHRRHAPSLKRGHGRGLISFEEMPAEDWLDLEGQGLSAEKVYDRNWAMTLLGQVFFRLTSEGQDPRRLGFVERLGDLLSDEPGCRSQAEIAREFDMTENAVKQAFHRFRERYRQVLREEVAHTVATPAEIEGELRDLIAALRA